MEVDSFNAKYSGTETQEEIEDMTGDQEREAPSAAITVLPLRAPVMDAMELIFGLEETIREGGVTISEIREVAKVAVSQGHDMLAIALSMCSIAMDDAKHSNRADCLSASEPTTEAIFKDFWEDIVCPNGKWDFEQVKKELADFKMVMDEVTLVYDHVTGGDVFKVVDAARSSHRGR